MISINILWHIFQLVVFLVLSIIFSYKVFENHLSVSKKGFLVRVSIYITLFTVLVCLFFTQVSPFPQYIGIGFVLMFALVFAFYRTVTDKKLIFLLFVLFIMINIQISSFLLARATLDFSILPAVSEYEYGDFLLLSSLYGIVIFWIVYFTLVKYYKRIVEEDIVLEQTKGFFWLPLLFCVSIAALGATMLKTFGGIKKEFLLPLLFLNIYALISYYAGLKSITDSYDAAAEREKLTAAQSQMNLWHTQYDSLQEKIQFEARARHDWRQHIITIMGFVDAKNLEGLEEYLGDYKEKYLLPDKAPVCDIPSLNMLFGYYERKAEGMKVRLSIGTVLFGDCLISVSELSILFGNLLANALEACEKVQDGEKYIDLKIMRDKNKIILSCENSFDGFLYKNKDKIISRKKDGGIGLASALGIVQKYDGEIKVEDKGHVFKIYAFLQNAVV